MNGFFKTASFWMVLLLIFIIALTLFQSDTKTEEKLGQLDFEGQLDAGNVEKITVTLKGEDNYLFDVKLRNKVQNQDKFTFTSSVFEDKWRDAIKKQNEEGNKIAFQEVEYSGLWQSLFLNILPLILLLAVFWFFMFRHMQGGSNKALSFGKSRARLANNSEKVVTFQDVAGVDEAKEELQEIIEFLRDPKKFTRLGGKIPKGVLLVGPPGSGKTLLARAVAGEANVPFFSISGSDFVEMFVGVGASRVRDLFQQGQKHAPCIIFIDEIDAVGRQRGAGLGGGHDEREQTLNQLLVEMDGFNTNDGVILMAATNRPDVLDKALLRPGRFDRQIVVANPDISGREAIIQIHIRNNKVPADDSVNVRTLGRGTPGFSGADLANMVNEAALLAARRNQDKVTMIDFEDAKDKVMMGPERRSMVISENEKLITAVHEAGHALLCRLLPDADPVHKVTIIPRGPSLGLTSWLPEEDRHNLSKRYCLAMMRVAMGGRAAEEVVFDEFTSGAAADLKGSTHQAHAMVCEWGMSDLGPISFGSNNEVFLGRDFVKEREFSEETASAIDHAIHKFLEDAYNDAKALIIKHRTILDAITEALIERETLDGEELDELIRRNGGGDLIPPPKKEKEPLALDDEKKEALKKAGVGDREDDADPEVGDVASDGPLPDTV